MDVNEDFQNIEGALIRRSLAEAFQQMPHESLFSAAVLAIHSNHSHSHPTMSMETVDVSPIPDSDLQNFRQQVMALPLRKQAKWYGHTKDTDGVVHRVRFVDGNLVVKDKSSWVRLVSMTDLQKKQEFGDVEFDVPRNAEGYKRLTNAFDCGGREAAAQELNRMRNEAATGNHSSKPHKIRVPTKAGEPVRA